MIYFDMNMMKKLSLFHHLFEVTSLRGKVLVESKRNFTLQLISIAMERTPHLVYFIKVFWCCENAALVFAHLISCFSINLALEEFWEIVSNLGRLFRKKLELCGIPHVLLKVLTKLVRQKRRL
jgi:hypothetical protein